MKTYSKAPDETRDRITHLVKCFHHDLIAAGVKIDLLSVSNDSPESTSALRLHGYPCAAIVRVVGLKERVKGGGDAEIVIDEAVYLKLNDAEKDALLDHELYHIEVIRDGSGRIKLDACHRPKLGMKKHDHQFGWFSEIATRHGAAAMECKQATALMLAESQSYFAFVNQPLIEDPNQQKLGIDELRKGAK